ncbi:MCP four helix bundle domain-containing protein [Photobacterium alginatilyticum]|uniref:Chemotaxis methyl-accepting receptor HlyB-like 4HB MCP domain-containing protein n=1 Tax=Photobacterium alginatilyticum TaxID=1775171 RepID=A0ABW9YLU1_9GAMM|nr:MCP four helix bundle domain-containing protein [Photobacterium alginatilyticum]NBI54832.1 hypothetical protein [Photobacterium alginatilyticum]
MNVKTKLLINYFLVILSMIVLSGYFVSRIELIGNLTVKMYNHPLTVTRAATYADADIVRMHLGMKDVVLAKNLAARDAAITDVSRLEEKVFENLAIVKEKILGVEGAKLIEETIDVFRQW